MGNKIQFAKEIIKRTLGRKDNCNCYLPYNTVVEKIDNKYFDVIVSGEVVLLIEDKQLFHNMYYFIKSISDVTLDDIKQSLSQYKILSVNIIDKGNNFVPNTILEKLGFSFYKKYIRKSLVNMDIDIISKEEDIEFAQINDIEEIYSMLHESFDVVTDTLPDYKELTNMIEKKWIIKKMISGELAGAFLFEDTGYKSYARALCVKPQYKNCKIGFALYIQYISLHLNTTKLFYSWVDSSRIEAINIHTKLGYKDDGVFDYIFTRTQVSCD